MKKTAIAVTTLNFKFVSLLWLASIGRDFLGGYLACKSHEVDKHTKRESMALKGAIRDRS